MIKYINRKTFGNLFFFFISVYLSSVLFICVNFPTFSTDVPSATAEVFPVNGISVFLENYRIVFSSGYGFLQSVVALLLFWFFRIKFESIKKLDYYSSPLLRLISFIFGISNTFGLCIYHLDYIPCFRNGFGVFFTLFLVLGLSILFFYLSVVLLFWLDKYELSRSMEGGSAERKDFMFSFLMIMFGWLPWIISYYPASMDNDVFAQLNSWINEPSNNHPWVATCILGLFYEIGKILGNDNTGVFLFVFTRNIIIAAIYAKSSCILKTLCSSKRAYYLTIAYYAITPVWGAYAKHAFKDTLSTGLFGLFILCTINLLAYIRKNERVPFVNIVQYSVSFFIVSLLRHNIIYATLPGITLIIVILKKKKESMKKIICLFVAVAVFFATEIGISQYTVVKPGGTGAISILLQQTARTLKYHTETISEEDLRGINSMFISDNMGVVYDPVLSDPLNGPDCIRPKEQRSEGYKKDYLTTWFRMMFEYPDTYVEAAVAQSYGYYSFTPRLPEQAGNWNSGMTVFDWIGCSSDFEEKFDYHYLECFDDIRQILHAWSKAWDKIPVLNLTDICAFYTWSIILLLYWMCMRRRFLFLPVYCPVIILILTCIASPVNDCFRYYAPVAVSFPLIIATVLYSERMEV